MRSYWEDDRRPLGTAWSWKWGQCGDARSRSFALCRSRMGFRGRIERRAKVFERPGDESRGDEPGQHHGAHGKEVTNRAALAPLPDCGVAQDRRHRLPAAAGLAPGGGRPFAAGRGARPVEPEPSAMAADATRRGRTAPLASNWVIASA